MSSPSDGSVAAFILISGFIGIFISVLYTWFTAKIVVDPSKRAGVESDGLLDADHDDAEGGVMRKVYDIYETIYKGAHSFLYQEYTYMAVFIVVFSVIIVVVIGASEHHTDSQSWVNGVFTAIAFIVGCCTSILAGLLGMKIGVFANARTALEAQKSISAAFVCSFRAGMVMGFSLVAFGVINLWLLVSLFRYHYTEAFSASCSKDTDQLCAQTRALFEAIAGYGLGGSSIAMFARVGGGIYTKAADVGADLVGKVEAGIPEDDPRNPAVIADNVGDNVGDIAGMGADLFGSFAESSCAALVLASQSPEISRSWAAMSLPILVVAAGILVCLVTSFVATNLLVVKTVKDIEPALKYQLFISTILMTPTVYALCVWALPNESITFVGYSQPSKPWQIFFCLATGLWSGLIIGLITEYFTSASYRPTREVAESCETGAATNIIFGLALGYKSVIIPTFCLALTIFVSHYIAGLYGVALGAIGILSTMAIGLTIDAYGPICDNAGGIAEMAGMGEEIRDRTDALDAAGNTTAAIGKGFAISSAAMVSLALFGGFVTNAGLATKGVNLLKPFPFIGLVIGAMLPYWFFAMTMKSVGKAAWKMVQEVRRQFKENPGILQGTQVPDYAKCIQISTDASLREMIAPGVLVMGTPLLAGFLFGTEALAGVLAGGLVSGVQMAISSSNAGGAWDNAKKYVSSGGLGEGKGKGSDEHSAAIIGDTVGDPFKDTSGPALNILMKLMAVESLVFAAAFPTHYGGYFGQLVGLVEPSN